MFTKPRGISFDVLAFKTLKNDLLQFLFFRGMVLQFVHCSHVPFDSSLPFDSVLLLIYSLHALLPFIINFDIVIPVISMRKNIENLCYFFCTPKSLDYKIFAVDCQFRWSQHPIKLQN